MIHLRLLGPLGLSAADGSEVRTVITQPKRLALLAYLASAGPGRFQRRDALLALFWPESSERQARLALRQALHHLRQALGPSVIINRGDGELAVEPDTLLCDAVEFRRRLDYGDLEDALELYRGDFLQGFSISGISVALEEWMEAERAALRSLAADAASALAERATGAEELGAAVQWGRRALSLSPGDESMLRRLVTLLDLRGDRAGALRTAEQFARRFHDELGAEISAETAKLVADLRMRDGAKGVAHAGQGGGSEANVANQSERPVREVEDGSRSGTVMNRSSAIQHADPPTFSAAPASREPHSGTDFTVESGHRTLRRARRHTHRRVAIAGASLVLLAVLVALGAVRLHAERSSSPVIAVGWIAAGDSTNGQGASRILPALLETGLADVPGQRTVSDARLHDVLGQMGNVQESRDAVTRAAQLAGATELLEGTVHHVAGNRLRLELRRVSIGDGSVLRTYRVEGRTSFELADNAAARIAADLRLPPPSRRAEDGSTTSLVARRFFEEGLRTYYQVDVERSNRFFRAAIREDSNCAMCAYYASLSESDAAAKNAYLRMAVRLSARAPERERLYIQSTWSVYAGTASGLAAARALQARLPRDPEAQLRMAGALLNSGYFHDALAHLRRVIQLDSLALRGAGPHCRACDAEGMLVSAYWLLDSFPAAERAARGWVRIQPGSRSAWSMLAETYSRMGHFAEARAALDSGATVSDPAVESDDGRVALAIRSGDFEAADSYLAYRVRSGTPYVRREALWWLSISLRNQGRPSEALAMMEAPPPARDMAIRHIAHYPWELGRGQLLFELGRFREAATLYHALAAERPVAIEGMPGVLARHRSWSLTHEAEALAAAGDTAALPALIDSVERIGAESALGRDRLLHHHVRGLLLAARGDWSGAETEFRAAIYSPTDGYLRTNLRLAHALLKEERPREAVAFLQAALRGPLDGGGLYVTRTELHEALGEAFEMAGEADSASSHYSVVARAWARGDPDFGTRAALAQRLIDSR